MDTDVLIVGAGPTGLMLANQLARRGIRSLIIDRHAGPSLQTRALGVQARTLEIYAQLGITERAIALGKRGDGAQLWAQGRKTARVPLIDAGTTLTPYPYILVLGQDDNERLMGERLHDFGQSVHWNTELVALHEHHDGVDATLALSNGQTRHITARWVAGCDGSRSRVRELKGISFPGAPYEHVFFVADVKAKGNMTPDEVNVFLWRDGFHLFFPMRGDDHWRIVGILPKQLRDRDDVGFDDVTPSLSTDTGLDLDIAQCSWFSTYRIHHRAASRFRAGRCFLLGDAAHVHSPVGAQGMNTGLQDAYNLAWKLALASEGRADDALLDSYENERMPVAQRLLDTTDRGFRMVVSDNPMAGLLRTKVIARIAAVAMRQPGVQQAAFRTVSQIGIHYPDSMLSHATSPMTNGSPRAGDRFPWMHLAFRTDGGVQDSFKVLDDMHFHLLVFGQPLPSELDSWNGMLRTHAVPSTAHNAAECERVGIPERSFFLLRPDGHIGLCGIDFDPAQVQAYARDRLRLTP